jgi:hypothetical protein
MSAAARRPPGDRTITVPGPRPSRQTVTVTVSVPGSGLKFRVRLRANQQLEDASVTDCRLLWPTGT